MSRKFKFKPDKKDPDDPTTKCDNSSRARVAEVAVEKACAERKECVCIDEDSICDLFADMCHLCDREGLSAHKLIARAKRSWRAER